jgi:TPR repeat protein
VKQDLGEAMRWFRKAAAQGHEGAKSTALKAKGLLQQQRQATPASQPSSSRTCAGCGVAEAAGGGA